MWVCPSCNEINSELDLQCSKCNVIISQVTQKYQQLDESEVRQNNWKCPSCNEEYSDEYAISSTCLKCGSKRPYKLKTPRQVIENNSFTEQSERINRNERTENENGGFFAFRTLISPVLIKIIYVIGLLAISITGFYILTNNNVLGSASGLIGIGILIVGNILWRLLCEAWILHFSMHEMMAEQLQILRSNSREMNPKL